MKTFKFFKTRLVLIGVLIMSVSQMWADNWYQQNNTSNIYFNDRNTGWVSDPSSNGIAFLMGRDVNYGGAGAGSQAYRMAHIKSRS